MMQCTPLPCAKSKIGSLAVLLTATLYQSFKALKLSLPTTSPDLLERRKAECPVFFDAMPRTDRTHGRQLTLRKLSRLSELLGTSTDC
mmetsp:Transcript_89033/g.157701  ORF Transcript_89033/g.157701 Transcript_89033/m.157701 type:complete len:88 (+) Transcript_89033:223-486(+)